MLTDAPEVDEVFKKFEEWMGDHTLVAHNASFDMGFINVGFKKAGLEKQKSSNRYVRACTILIPRNEKSPFKYVV